MIPETHSPIVRDSFDFAALVLRIASLVLVDGLVDAEAVLLTDKVGSTTMIPSLAHPFA